MISVTTPVQGPAFIGLTGGEYFLAFVSSISFLNDSHSNFLNAFFYGRKGNIIMIYIFEYDLRGLFFEQLHLLFVNYKTSLPISSYYAHT